MTIQLRAGSLHDLHALQALDKACFPAGISYSLWEMRHFLSRANSICLVAEDESGKLAGFVIAEVAIRAKRRAAHIVTIDVHSAFRRQGIGRLLMQTIESALAEQGAASIRLEVSAEDQGAQQFYSGLGYQPMGTLRGYYLGKLDALVMEKELNPLSLT